MGQIIIRMLITQLAQRYGKNRTGKSLIIAGSLFIVVAMACYFSFFGFILDTILEWLLQLKNDGFIFNYWKDVPYTINVWAFYLKNGAKFQNGLEWPRMHEIGPFVFNVRSKKDILGWFNENSFVRYDEQLTIDFDESQSVGPLTMRISTVNVLFLLFIRAIRSTSKSIMLDSNLTTFIQQKNLIEELSIREILNIDQSMEGFNQFLLQIFNNRTIGPIEVFTGQSSQGLFNHFHTYKEKTSLTYFQNEFCNQIKGSDGIFFDRCYAETNKYLFKPCLGCRPWKLKYNGKSRFGLIATEQYLVDENQFSITQSLENWCYCPKDLIEDECDGLFNLYQCQPGSPYLLTNVHFLQTPHLLRMVRGLQPDPIKHQGYLEVEPTLGASVESRLRFQINLDMRKNYHENLTRYRPVVFPYFWMEENYSVRGPMKYILAITSSFLTIYMGLFRLMGCLGAGLIIMGIVKLIQEITNKTSSVGIQDNGK